MAVPGGFGTGKTMIQHALAKWCAADIILFIGCGERCYGKAIEYCVRRHTGTTVGTMRKNRGRAANTLSRRTNLPRFTARLAWTTALGYCMDRTGSQWAI